MTAKPKRYILIDYENVQPETLGRLDSSRDEVLIFAGAKQSKMRMSLVTAMRGFNWECIQITGSGHNALDLHIAYYLGRIAASEPGASFHVISKDAGFDPLMRHLKAEGIAAKRITATGVMPETNASRKESTGTAAATLPDAIETITDNLRRRPNARPRTVGTLQTVIRELLQKKLKNEADAAKLFDQLVKLGVVRVQGTKVSYRL